MNKNIKKLLFTTTLIRAISLFNFSIMIHFRIFLYVYVLAVDGDIQ